MASPRIFVSSTCYDLTVLRGHLRGFIISMGFEPVMSDFLDVLYDPSHHTHASCLREVESCDAIVVIIGSRFGGELVASELSKLAAMKSQNFDPEILKKKELKFSITQAEVITAIHAEIPLFVFVDEHVLHDHHVYEKNKSEEFSSRIKFPSIDKPDSAKYIFEFINILKKRVTNNSIIGFGKHDDIESALRKQWAGLFQRLLYNERKKLSQQASLNAMTEQFENLRAAIVSSFKGDARAVAKGVLKFRRLICCLSSLPGVDKVALKRREPFDTWLADRGYISVSARRIGGRRRVFFETKDGGALIVESLSAFLVNSLPRDWDDFSKLDDGVKNEVIDVSLDIEGVGDLIHVSSAEMDDLKASPMEDATLSLGHYISRYSGIHVQEDVDSDSSEVPAP